MAQPLKASGAGPYRDPAVGPGDPGSVTVGVVPILVLARNNYRLGAAFVNLSTTNNISFGLGRTPVAGKGITLTPNGAWWMDHRATFFTTEAIYAIATADPSELAFQEF